jgi:N-acetylmuramoyl-L-alanine amidase
MPHGTGSSGSAGCDRLGPTPLDARRPRKRGLWGPDKKGTGSLTLRMKGLPSPNFDDRPPGSPLDILILHYTGMPTAQAAIERLCDPAPPTGRRVSSHYIVDEDGAILRLVEEDRRAWHAGASFWRGSSELNARSIGIEIVNPGHEFGYRAFPVLQLAAVCDLCLSILSRHPIPARNVVGHSDVAPDRKQDPGELFDWEALAQNGVGLWPEDVPDMGGGGAARDAGGLADARRMLAAIGYQVAEEGPLDAPLASVLRAFQRHWRAEAITGEADARTFARLLGVARLVEAEGRR